MIHVEIPDLQVTMPNGAQKASEASEGYTSRDTITTKVSQKPDSKPHHEKRPEVPVLVLPTDSQAEGKISALNVRRFQKEKEHNL